MSVAIISHVCGRVCIFSYRKRLVSSLAHLSPCDISDLYSDNIVISESIAIPMLTRSKDWLRLPLMVPFCSYVPDQSLLWLKPSNLNYSSQNKGDGEEMSCLPPTGIHVFKCLYIPKDLGHW